MRACKKCKKPLNSGKGMLCAKCKSELIGTGVKCAKVTGAFLLAVGIGIAKFVSKADKKT
jgi:hypothetical protein